MAVEKIKFMLMAQNMERAVEFYRSVFRLNVAFTSDHWSELTFGDAIVALHGGGNGKPNPTGLSIQVDDAAQTFDAITRAGGAVLERPAGRPGEPILLGRFRDPEGNEVMLTQWVG